MQTLEVSLTAADVVIGTAVLAEDDPSMGVASGIFHPNDFYRPEEHASFLDDRVLFDLPGRTLLTAHNAGGSRIECASVVLTDYSDALGPEELKVEILGMAQYESYFG
ncbi:MAG: hypothetical protein ABI810_01510 [Sphingomonas bacterium]